MSCQPSCGRTRQTDASAKALAPSEVATHAGSNSASVPTVDLRQLLVAEGEKRGGIYGRIYQRVRAHSPHGVPQPHLPQRERDDPENRQGVAGRLVGNLRSISPEALIAFIPVAEPISIGTGMLEMRKAAHVAYLHPERQKEARAMLLMGLSEVMACVYAASSIMHPFGALVAVTVTSGAKLLNAAYKVARSNSQRDPMLNTAARISELPVIKSALNVALKAMYRLERKIVTSALDPLKDNFSVTASTEERRQGESLLRQYVALHNKSYPSRLTSYAALAETLKNTASSDNVCVVRSKDGIVGGFSFSLEERKDGRVLRITEITPTRELDPEAHEAVWDEVLEYSILHGARDFDVPSDG